MQWNNRGGNNLQKNVIPLLGSRYANLEEKLYYQKFNAGECTDQTILQNLWAWRKGLPLHSIKLYRSILKGNWGQAGKILS